MISRAIARRQMPSLLHILGLHADNRADLLLVLRYLGVCKLARPTVGANPVFGATRFAVRRGNEGVAAKADHVSKTQLCKKAEQLGVAKAAIGEDRHLRPVGQRLLQPAEAHVFEIVPLSC